jgi:predicted nucleic acid-binding protein
VILVDANLLLHAETVEQCRAESPRLAGNPVHDFHAAVFMREHAVSRILTFDDDFRAFPWVRVMSP